MRSVIEIASLSIAAAAAIDKNLFVGFDGAVCAAGAKSLGVSNANAASGEQLSVMIRGVAMVTAAAAIARGAAVTSDASGKATTAAALAAAAPAIAVDGTKVTAAAPEITVDDTKLSIDSGETPVLSSAANGAVISAASGFLTPAAPAITVAAGFLTPAAPALSGGVLPVAVNGYALDEATQADMPIRVMLV